MQHARQRGDLVAHDGRLLELERLGIGMHLLLERGHQLGLSATQELRGIVDIDRIVFFADQVHAGSAAAIDLVQQAGARAVLEDRVLAGAQQEDLLQDLHRLLHRPCAGKRTEVLVLLVDCAAVIGHARIVAAGQLQVGIGLVVPEQNVEARLLRLDQVVLEQQGLGLAAHDGGLHARDAADHDTDARALVVLLEIARDALLQVARLAHVEHGAVLVEITIHTGQVRQARHLFQQRRTYCVICLVWFVVGIDGGVAAAHGRVFVCPQASCLSNSRAAR